MNQLSDLEKEFKTKMMLAVNESEKWGYPPNKTIDIFAKAAATLCEKKMREVHLAHLKFWGISEDDVTMKSLYEKLLKDL